MKERVRQWLTNVVIAYRLRPWLRYLTIGVVAAAVVSGAVALQRGLIIPKPLCECPLKVAPKTKPASKPVKKGEKR